MALLSRIGSKVDCFGAGDRAMVRIGSAETSPNLPCPLGVTVVDSVGFEAGLGVGLLEAQVEAELAVPVGVEG